MKVTENFKFEEFECKHCGLNLINDRIVHRVQVVRDIIGRSITVVSGCRCETHNGAVGGKPHSLHLTGEAVDFTCDGIGEVAELLNNWSGGYHYYPGQGFIHIDIGARRRWK